MPKAMVATMTSTSSMRNLSWFSARVAAVHAGVIRQGAYAVDLEKIGYGLHLLRLRQYMMPDLPGFCFMNLMSSLEALALDRTS